MWSGDCVRGRGEACFLLAGSRNRYEWKVYIWGRCEKQVGSILGWTQPQILGDPGKSLSSSSWCWGVGCPTHQVGLGSILKTKSIRLCRGNRLKVLDYTSEHLIGTFHSLFCGFRNIHGFPGSTILLFARWFYRFIRWCWSESRRRVQKRSERKRDSGRKYPEFHLQW